jgi:hypothetical protein
MHREELFAKVREARDAFWSSVGEVDPHVLTDGEPCQWPTFRRAFRIVRRAGGILFASEGLSDAPLEPDRSEGGFEMEVYAETRDPLGDAPHESWLFQIVWQAAELAASRAGLGDLLDRVDVLSTQVELTDPAASELVDEEGRAGILLNLTDEKILPGRLDLPNGPTRLVNAKLLHPLELAYLTENGDRGREELARRLLAEPDPLVSSLHRAPVVRRFGKMLL